MDEISLKFNEAILLVEKNKNFFSDNSSMLKLYGFYKCATIGPCDTPQPSYFHFRDRAKWDAWNQLGPISKSEAMNLYSEYVDTVINSDSKGQVSKTHNQSNVRVSVMESQREFIRDSDKTAFQWVEEGNLDRITTLLESGKIDLDTRDENGLTLLHWASDRGHLEIGKYLLSLMQGNSALINAQDQDGWTALHYASMTGERELVAELLRNGADSNIRDLEGKTAKDLAEDPLTLKVFSQ